MTLSLATINVNGLRDKKKLTQQKMIWFDGKMNGKTVGVAIAFLIVVRVTQGVWEFYWANNLKKM